jgi:hypothetical protein
VHVGNISGLAIIKKNTDIMPTVSGNYAHAPIHINDAAYTCWHIVMLYDVAKRVLVDAYHV